MMDSHETPRGDENYVLMWEIRFCWQGRAIACSSGDGARRRIEEWSAGGPP